MAGSVAAWAGPRSFGWLEIQALAVQAEALIHEGRKAEATAVGEASTMYLECPQAAGRIKALIPEAGIICGLRDPVDRVISAFYFMRSYKLHPLYWKLRRENWTLEQFVQRSRRGTPR